MALRNGIHGRGAAYSAVRNGDSSAGTAPPRRDEWGTRPFILPYDQRSRPVTREQAVYGPPSPEPSRFPPQNHSNGQYTPPPPPPPPHLSHPQSNNPVRRFDILSDEPPPPQSYPERRLRPQPPVVPNVRSAYAPYPPDLRQNDYRGPSPPPAYGQDRRPPPPLVNNQDRRPQPPVTPSIRSAYAPSPPPGLRQNDYPRGPSPPPSAYGQDRRPPPIHDQDRLPPFYSNMRSAFPEPAPREMQYEREESVVHTRPPHDYRNSVVRSPVPSMRSRPDARNDVPEQGNRRDFHRYFEAEPRAPRSRQPPMLANGDNYCQRDDQESFNQEFQERNVISQPPPPPTGLHSIRGGYNGVVGSGRGGFNGATNSRGGFNGSIGRGGYNGFTSTRGDFNGTNNSRGGLNDAPRSNRYDDRRNSDAPASAGYRGFQQLDAQSTNRNRAPRNYVPCNRNVEEIFNEDSSDVTRHANTIFDGDAEIEVMGESVPIRCERWIDMKLDDQLLNNIRKSEYRRPRNIQQFVIPYIQDKYNMKCQSETGSGKTAAFLIPIIDNMIREKCENTFPTDGPVCLIILPTRELALQLYEQAKKFADGTDISVSYAYGQVDSAKNLHDIRRGCNILCATLGRLLDFVESSHITLSYVKYLVIDEADRLMDNRDDNNGILKLLNFPQLPKKEDRQTMLFSATLRDPIVEDLADQYIYREKQVFIIAKNESNVRINYQVLAVPSVPAKFRYLMEYLKQITAENGGKCPRVLIFVNRKINVDRVAIDISSGGFPATTIHGERAQDLREEALQSFKSGKTRCLVATDVCARGVDIKDMDYVINYDLPENRTGFVQRCGRTGRTHKGVAMSLYCEANDMNMAQIIDGIINDAGQVSPEFLRNGVRDGDFVYEPQNNSSRQENDYSPSTVEPDSGYSRNNSPSDEQTNIADNEVDDGWN